MQSNFTTVTWSILIAPPSVRQSRTAEAAFIKLSCLSIRARFVRLSLCVLWGDVNASGKWRTQRSPRPVLGTWLKCSPSNTSFVQLKHELHKIRFHVPIAAPYHQASRNSQSWMQTDGLLFLVNKEKNIVIIKKCLHTHVGLILRKNDLESCGRGQSVVSSVLVEVMLQSLLNCVSTHTSKYGTSLLFFPSLKKNRLQAQDYKPSPFEQGFANQQAKLRRGDLIKRPELHGRLLRSQIKHLLVTSWSPRPFSC